MISRKTTQGISFEHTQHWWKKVCIVELQFWNKTKQTNHKQKIEKSGFGKNEIKQSGKANLNVW